MKTTRKSLQHRFALPLKVHCIQRTCNDPRSKLHQTETTEKLSQIFLSNLLCGKDFNFPRIGLTITRLPLNQLCRSWFVIFENRLDISPDVIISEERKTYLSLKTRLFCFALFGFTRLQTSLARSFPRINIWGNASATQFVDFGSVNGW